MDAGQRCPAVDHLDLRRLGGCRPPPDSLRRDDACRRLGRGDAAAQNSPLLGQYVSVCGAADWAGHGTARTRLDLESLGPRGRSGIVVLRGTCEYFAEFEPRALTAYENLAAATDALAPANGTLLVLGKMPCEAIQFASRLRPANVYEWMFQFIKPNHEILPTPFDEITQQYLAAPPDVLVIEGGQHVCCDPKCTPGEDRDDVRLVRQLLRRHSYEPAARMGDFEISLRVGK